jgi:hypothetical protein
MNEFACEVLCKGNYPSEVLSDLQFQFKSPDGKAINLNIGRYLDFTYVESGDSNWTLGIAPFVGSWAPENPLESLENPPALGEFLIVRAYNSATKKAFTQLIRVSFPESGGTPEDIVDDRKVRYGQVFEDSHVDSFTDGLRFSLEGGSIKRFRDEIGELSLPEHIE